MKSSWGSNCGLLDSDWVFFHLIKASTAWVVVEEEIAIREEQGRRVRGKGSGEEGGKE